MNKILVIIFCYTINCIAQGQFSKAIEDNSFFIEEAYNQEEGVVQHIFTGPTSSDLVFNEFSFTQEWPVYSQTHQFSYSIPYLLRFSVDGIGDIILNYRYQLTNENSLAVSPRFSLILPTGNKTKGLGDGVVGMQLNLPVSKRWLDEFITHFNAGMTLLPKVSYEGREKTLTTYFAGASGIFLATPHSNILLEALYSSTNGSEEFILSPGLRIAFDIGNSQLVPGIAFPFYSKSDSGSIIYLYLSFEHPF
jgi:hypothetical protein